MLVCQQCYFYINYPVEEFLSFGQANSHGFKFVRAGGIVRLSGFKRLPTYRHGGHCRSVKRIQASANEYISAAVLGQTLEFMCLTKRKKNHHGLLSRSTKRIYASARILLMALFVVRLSGFRRLKINTLMRLL